MAELQVLRRTCDFCGEMQEFKHEQITPADALRVQGWAMLVRVFMVNGQSYPVQKHACKDSCAQNIIHLGMLDLPKEIKDALAEEEKQKVLFAKKMKEAQKAKMADHPFSPDSFGVLCNVEGCTFAAIAHPPAAEA